jgi:DNA-binding winged helix-turn-helix (wHTH) protein
VTTVSASQAAEVWRFPVIPRFGGRLKSLRVFWQCLLGSSGLAILTACGISMHLRLATVSCLYLLVVFVMALLSGFWQASLTSISAVRRRNTQDANHDAPIRHGHIEIDPVKYRVRKRGQFVHLTPKEFELLHYLMLHAGQPIPHARLLRSVWGPNYGNELEYLRTFVRQLRKKIEDDPRNPQYLLTDAYIGYRFNEQVQEN